MIRKEIALFAAYSLILASCTARTYPPTRPNDIPESAIWHGGIDGGNWVHCHMISKSELECKTYFGEFATADDYMIQKLEICANSNLSEWYPSTDGIGVDPSHFAKGSIYLRPLEAPVFIRNGTKEQWAVDKYANVFENEASNECPVKLAIIKP